MSASALRTNVPLIKVSFNNVNVFTDFVTNLDSASYGPPLVGIPVMALVNTDSSFWIQKDTNGKDQLCTAKTTSAQMKLTFMSGPTTFTRTADPFIVAYHDESGLPVYMPFPQL